MKASQWRSLTAGAQIKRVSTGLLYQVAKVDAQGVRAIRLLEEPRSEDGAEICTAEIVQIKQNSDDWVYPDVNARRVVLTGGFSVRRSTGAVEYDDGRRSFEIGS